MKIPATLTLNIQQPIDELPQASLGQQIPAHPMIGMRCLIRTHSAGVHIGNVVWINQNTSEEIKLSNALRLWSWEKGGLSLSDIANKGVVKARLNRTGDIFLTNVIEFIPTTPEAEATYAKFIE